MGEKKLRILLAERHPGETASVLRSLYPEGENNLELTIVSSVSTLLATLDIINPEVIFLDLTLANSDTLNAVRRVHRSASAVPLIVLADASEKDCALGSLSHGRLDYLLRGFIYFLPLTRASRGVKNRRKTSSLVVSLLSNCHEQYASEAADLPGRAGLLSRRGIVKQHPTTPEVRMNLFSPLFYF